MQTLIAECHSPSSTSPTAGHHSIDQILAGDGTTTTHIAEMAQHIQNGTVMASADSTFGEHNSERNILLREMF